MEIGYGIWQKQNKKHVM